MRAAWLLAVVAGCALTSKAPPLEIRYFSPQPAHPVKVESEPVNGRLRLDRVTAASHLRSQIAHRRSPVELELSDTQRWAEDPEDYARRSLERSLLARGIELAVTGDALSLSVEVTGFEDVVHDGRHFGRVQLHYRLENDVRVIAEDTVTVERPSAGPDISQVVTAIGDALSVASAQVADRLAPRVASRS
ncbi:MAG TPA: ABC-type transport auxiliary lipoprotein family protein [Kofleriaceae bacterium]|nr:ABC-type transport auxiliary lipoprotein family protein [Kofleriaceae bacterium]